MKLLVDIGNTAVKIGCVKENKFSFIGRLYNVDVKESILLELLKSIKNVEGIYISSVAPKVKKEVETILINKYHCPIINISIEMNDYIDIAIDNKNELGIDLLCDLVAAKTLYGPKTAVIDFGTATKILFIDENGVFSSCAIFLGYSQSKKILSNSTELLPNVNDIKIKPISDCHNTIDVINSSAYYSQLFSVIGIIHKYEEEVGYPSQKVFTGGNAKAFLEEIGEEQYDEYLLLKGLAILSERN